MVVGYKSICLVILYQFISTASQDPCNSNSECRGSNFVCNSFSECRDSDIICNSSLDCNISCTGTNGCTSAKIFCPADANCIIDCGNADSCRNMNVTAILSTSLTLNCPTSTRGCDYSSIYCPNNGHSGPISCKITGVNDKAIVSGIEIYAVEGFNDVEVTGPSLKGTSTIHCKDNYQTDCPLSIVSPYQCAACQNILSPSQFPTEAPSNDPTNDPTQEPTNEPTIYPTYTPTANTAAPTTIIPTKHPTVAPSIDPTVAPSNDPSNDPSLNPTRDPTVIPTKAPTKIPTNGPTTSPDNNHTAPPDKDGLFSNTSNIIILCLCILIVILLCVFGIYILRKYREKRMNGKEAEGIIAVEMSSTKETNGGGNATQNESKNVSVGKSGSAERSVSGTVGTEDGEDMYIDNDDPLKVSYKETAGTRRDSEDVDEELYTKQDDMIIEGNSPNLTAMKKQETVGMKSNINNLYIHNEEEESDSSSLENQMYGRVVTQTGGNDLVGKAETFGNTNTGDI